MLISRPDDIFVASYPRSGTTLVQMILYQLLSSGDMTFGHISEVMPYLEQALRNGDEVNRIPSPRVLKTHLPYKQVSQWPGRHLYVSRDGRDVLVSYFHMYQNYVDSAIDFPHFFEMFLAGRVQYGSWFNHVATWTAQAGPNVLLVRYENLVGDTRAEIERIAAFIQISIAPDRYPRILERCSFEFMRRYETRFAPVQPVPSEDGAFIRKGGTGNWKELFTDEQRTVFERAVTLYGMEVG
jgi:hypothetical protein